MKYLIVNADDFGYSHSINRGIIKAHTNGIVTSTSVMVDAVAGDEASDLIKFTDLSIGLHLVLKDFSNIEQELKGQLKIFESLIERKPDHLDTHKMLPTDNKKVEKVLRKYSQENKIPVRAFGFAKFIDSFFGLNLDGSGIPNKENVSLASLKNAVDQATDKFNELMCHAGYADNYLRKVSSYNDMREKELQSLTNPDIMQYIKEKDLTLCNWKQVRVSML